MATVTLEGRALELVGEPLKAGDAAPDFEALGMDLTPVRLADFRGKAVLISAVPSLDTSVCSLETRKLNEFAARMSDQAAFLTISMDLPFAQARWCKQETVDAMKVASDHVSAEFGSRYGVLIKPLRLLARCVFVVGPDGKIAYRELVKEISDEPDYDAAIQALRKVAAK